MGNSTSKNPSGGSNAVISIPKQNEPVGGDSACPMRAKAAEVDAGNACPVRAKHNSTLTTEDTERSTDSDISYKHPYVYNVYNQKLDSTNNMPSHANQQPSPGQKGKLDQQRVKSTIPKGGTDNDTWQYPSPQMFWNALVRKNKVDGASEADIEAVVAVHNNMNETTWKQIMIWESLRSQHYKRGEEPKLLRFLGRPDDLSPRAYIKSLFGHPKPFDRHDWFVDSGGQQVRYIIDYYHDESNVEHDARPTSMHDTKSMKSIIVEVRPAVDSFQAVVDRLFIMPFKRFQKNPQVADYANVPFFPKSKMLHAESLKRQKIDTQWAQIQANCNKHRDLLQTCKTDQECSIATVQLQKCTASVACPEIVQSFNASIQSKNRNEDDIENGYTAMLKCLELFEIESKLALEEKNV